MLADGGSVVIADELVEDVFTVPTPVGERRSSGWSVVSCLPSAMDDPETAATGAVMRSTVLRRYRRRPVSAISRSCRSRPTSGGSRLRP
jgi:hypothetical protein